MTSFRKFLTSGLLALGLGIAGSANAAFVSFVFNPAGTGSAGGVQVGEYFDFIGAVYASNTYTGATTFNLQQQGYALLNGIDGDLPDVSLTGIVASYSGGGTGNLATGATSFTDGALNLYAGGFAGTLIASFDIVGGGAQITSTTGAPNGASTLVTRATFFAPGYFFTSFGGDDFSERDLDANSLFGFATSNLSLTTSSTTINSQRNRLLQAFPASTFTSGNVADENGRLTSLYSAANGQFRLVPEPGALALLGLGLLGLGAVRRRRTA